MNSDDSGDVNGDEMARTHARVPVLSALVIALLVTGAAMAAAAGCRRGGAPHPATGPAPEQKKAATASARPPQNAAECHACNGEWGVHGLLQVESCLCRTHDSGKRCRDGKECEGECVIAPGQTQVTDPGPPPRGFFLGTCSEFDHLFGCNKLLMDGTVAEGPTRLDEPPADVCID